MKNVLYKIRTIKALDIFNFGNYSPSGEVIGKSSDPNKETPYTPYNFNENDTDYIINTSTVSLIQENALFYQIERINSYQPILDGFNDNIIKDIIYIDFDDIYLADEKEDALSYSNEMRALLKYGFTLTYNENEEIFEVHYEKFERSGSMARDKRLSFIRKDLKIKDIENALRLDIKPEKVVLSKWYAYNGLMLSSGTRIDFPNDSQIKLNENSVIIVNDKVISEGDVKANLFDGEGIISPELANIIRNSLTYDRDNPKALPTSFQIRLPYVKGMLHQVDFHSFAKEPDVNAGTIIDCWGNVHKVEEVQIILTESMFKGKEWFEEHFSKECEKTEENWNEKEDSEKEKIIGAAAMKHYFEKFKEYGHAIYVTGFNKPQTGWINLNYQVLSTPEFKQEKFLELAKPLKEMYEALSSDNVSDENRKNAFLNNGDFFLPTDEVGENEEDSDENAQVGLINDEKSTYSRYDTGIRKAVRIKPELINSKKSKNCIENMADHTLAQYGIARFLVRGVNLYLSGDLLYFLYYIFKKDMPNDEGLYNDKFYAPGVGCIIYDSNKKDKTKNKKDKTKKKYAVLRNPHISNKELVSLNAFKPKEETKRKKYLKHLTGVLMINSSPIKVGDKMRPSIAEHLSGADYDGDIVKLVKEEEYNTAMPKFSEWSAYEFEPIPKPHDVPHVKFKPGDDSYEENVYKMLAMTFGNRIGLFSNYAFKHAVHAYNANDVESNKGYKEVKIKEKQDKLVELKKKKNEEAGETVTDEAIRKEIEAENIVVRYTEEAVDKLFGILGQEIDSAKTGKRPSIADELVIRGDDYFIEWKNAINSILKLDNKEIIKTVSEKKKIINDEKKEVEKEIKEKVIVLKDEDTIKNENGCERYPIVHTIKEGVIKPSINSKLSNFYILPYETLKLKGLVESEKIIDNNKEKEKVLIKPKGKTGPTEGEKQFNIGEFIWNCFDKHPDIDFNTVIGFAELVRKYNEAVSNLGKKKHARIESEKIKNDNIKRNTDEYMAILFKQYNDHVEKRNVMRGIVENLSNWNQNLGKERFDEIINEWLYTINPEEYLKEHFKNSNNECIFSEDKIEFLCNFSYGGYKLLIIALNLAYRVDYNIHNDNSEKSGRYSFDGLDDFREIDSQAKCYVSELFGKINKETQEEEKNSIIKTRLCYYAFCANLNGILSSNKERIFVSESEKGVVNFGKLCFDIEKGISDKKLTEEEGVVACISRIGNYSFYYGLRELFLKKSDALLTLATEGSVLYRCFQTYFKTITQLFISLLYGCKKFGNKRRKYTKTSKYEKYSAVKLKKCDRNAFKNRNNYINAFKNRKAILKFRDYFESKKRSAFKIKKGDIKFAMASFLIYCEDNCTFIQYAENFYNENITLKKENDSKSFSAYKRTKLNTRPNVKNFISLLLLGNKKYEFDNNENFLWSILGEDFLEVISADHSSNNCTYTENKNKNKEGSESND